MHVSYRPEPEMIEGIVTSLSETLNRMYPSYPKNQDLVGIGPRVDKIKRLLCLNRQGQNNLTLGIWGMAGIGKTTLAQAISNEVSNSTQFDACCFLANVSEELKKPGGIASLQDKLLSKILEEKSLHTDGWGSAFTSNRIRNKKVLLVLDDVNGLEQLETLALLGRDAFAPGSIVIMTSRDKQVLRNRVDEIYEVKALNYEESLQLFCLGAFKQNSPYNDFWDLADRFVGYARGNPLALKVLGSALYGQSKEYWESALRKLQGSPDTKILDALKISYDTLDRVEKDIFLDIACFFKGWNAEDVMKLCDSFHDGKAHCAVMNLIDRCLLNITTEGNIWMHDLLQELAQSIVHEESTEPGNRSRIWNPKDIDHVLRNNTGTHAIQGLSLDMSQSSLLQLSPNSFSRLSKLRFLNFHNSKRGRRLQISGGTSLEYLPSELRYLHWDGYPSKSLPPDFNPENLDTLALPNSDIEKLWDGDGVTKFPEVPLHITELNLSGTSIEEVPTSLSELESLEYLSLSGCPLRKFPENLPRSIKSLYLDKTNIEVVPSSIGYLSELSKLHMNGCERLKTIPASLCRLKHLEYLDFSNCSRLDGFPEILEPMETLWKLDLSGTALKGLPSSLSFLVGLEELRLNDCRNLTSLPNSLCSLTSLRLLYVQNCPNLVSVPDIKSLWRLKADETALLQLPSSTGHLEELSLSRCKDLKLGLFSGLTSVSNLCLRDSNISEIPEHLGELTNLSRLDLSKNEFTRIPTTIRRLPNLVELLVISCKRLRSMPVLPPCLKKLDAHNCTSLESVSQQPHCKPDDGPCSYQFSNCFNLDQDAYNKVVAHAQLIIQRVATTLVEAYQHCKMINGAASVFCLPGSDILGWFNHKGIGSSITVKLPSGWSKSTFSGFALCIVVDFKDYEDHCQSRKGFEQCPTVGSLHPTIHCRVGFKTKHGDCHNFSCKWQVGNDDEPRQIRRDHVLFLYHNDIYRSVVHMVDKDNCNEVSFDFFEENLRCKVKKCGVRLLYAKSSENFSSLGVRSRL
ncbi:Disease resistance protein [Corchorus olitorius]|uniref:ADP-ribosyl cyclase/cyclic ADP-ribose hydrolase n=1 Tax=Corchorus olitorius TaxID=93759 RepID=A0A1R3HZQ4_9ROSI|nr:Disease resistance protein [Corchorus olitorius]